MTRKYLALSVAGLTIFLNLVIPACGNKNQNNNPGFFTTTCTPGQVCSPGFGGVAMFNQPVVTSLDFSGSVAQLNISASNFAPGQTNFSGQVLVQAQVSISPMNTWGCPPGTFFFQGQGAWISNFGGSLGRIQAVLASQQGMQVNLNGEIFAGQDPFQPNIPTAYYYTGQFGNNCPGGAGAIGE